MLEIDEVAKAVEISSRYPKVHGAPVHIGDPVSSLDKGNIHLLTI